MSSGAVAERVAKLEFAGVIRGYHADVDASALGLAMRVLIGLQVEQGPPLAFTVAALLDVAEIVEVLVVSGQWDLVVIAEVRDVHHLREFVLTKMWSIAGFRHSETMLVLESHDTKPRSKRQVAEVDSELEDG